MIVFQGDSEITAIVNGVLVIDSQKEKSREIRTYRVSDGASTVDVIAVNSLEGSWTFTVDPLPNEWIAEYGHDSLALKPAGDAIDILPIDAEELWRYMREKIRSLEHDLEDAKDRISELEDSLECKEKKLTVEAAIAAFPDNAWNAVLALAEDRQLLPEERRELERMLNLVRLFQSNAINEME